MNKNKKRNVRHSQDYTGLREFKVDKDYELLEFLFLVLKDQSRNSVKSLLENRHVTVDGAPITQFNFHLSKGDTVIISKKPIHVIKRSKLPIIYEDDEFIVINKPSGLLTVASDNEKGSTVYRMMMDYVQQKDAHNRIYIVHRLDEDTSGVLMVTKNAKIRDLLQDKWNDLVKKRGYFAICEGTFIAKKGTIKTYLKKNNLNLMYSSNDSKNGQLAITHYEVIKENNLYSLLDVNIDTGRKNQIRVHLGERGHYVLGQKVENMA